MRKYAELVGLCGTCPIMRKIMRAHIHIIQPSLVEKAWVQITATTLSGNSLRQTAYTHHASVHQAAKLVAALSRVVRVTAGLVESNGSLPPGL